MFRRFSINFALLSISLDIVVVCLALLAATHLRPWLGFLPFAAEYPGLVVTPWPVYLLFALEWPAILLALSVYDGRRNLRQIDEFANLTLASLLAAVALAGTLYLSYRQVSRLLFVVFGVLAYLGMLGWRRATRLYWRIQRQNAAGQRRVLVVGAGPTGRELEEQILHNPMLGLHVVGFLDDRPGLSLPGEKIIGPISAVRAVIQAHKIDDVVIALPQRAYARINQLVGELHWLPVRVWLIPDYFRLALHKAAIEEFAGIPMIDLRAPALSDTQRLFKRAFDLAVTLLMMPYILPVMGLVALAIYLESGRPVLLRQQRVGENGRLFYMLKFRTMVPGAEALRLLVETEDAQGNPVHKTANDPRVTRLGKLLRRLSLDEYPQFFNVLRGDMSLVGPRPELPELVARYELWQRQRFAVAPGITGWWQVSGRSDRPMHLNTEDDIYYVQHYSFFLDIYILVKTIGVVLRGQGAF